MWLFFFFSSRRRHTRFDCDWSSDVCSSDLNKDHPASRDEPLVLYAVGLGPTTGGAVTAGRPSPSSPLAVTGAVEVFFGNPGYRQAAVIVDWSGLAPGLIGVYQLNLRVPGFHMNGDALPVTVRVG